MIGVLADGAEANGVTKSVYEVASLVFAEVDGETVHDGRIVNTILPGFVANGIPTIQMTATNNGNIHEKVTAKITIKNALNGEQVILDSDADGTYEATIMPESERVIERELNGLPMLGIFNIDQDVSYLGDSYHSSSTLIICPIWFIALVVAVFISIVAAICLGVRHRRKKQTLSINN